MGGKDVPNTSCRWNRPSHLPPHQAGKEWGKEDVERNKICTQMFRTISWQGMGDGVQTPKQSHFGILQEGFTASAKVQRERVTFCAFSVGRCRACWSWRLSDLQQAGEREHGIQGGSSWVLGWG